jgi:hypothetical protein
MNFIAISDDGYKMWAYTLQGIKDSVAMAGGRKWTVFQLTKIEI